MFPAMPWRDALSTPPRAMEPGQGAHGHVAAGRHRDHRRRLDHAGGRVRVQAHARHVDLPRSTGVRRPGHATGIDSAKSTNSEPYAQKSTTKAEVIALLKRTFQIRNHHGQLAVYLCLTGIVPPTTARRLG
jgi:hypothetical protein